MTNLIDQLDKATTDREESLQRLLNAVAELLEELDRHCSADWADVEVDGHRLQIVTVRSNVGECSYWYFDGANLELPTNSEKCLHGDCHARMHGPTGSRLARWEVQLSYRTLGASGVVLLAPRIVPLKVRGKAFLRAPERYSGREDRNGYDERRQDRRSRPQALGAGEER